jgi:hypothetical protein
MGVSAAKREDEPSSAITKNVLEALSYISRVDVCLNVGVAQMKDFHNLLIRISQGNEKRLNRSDGVPFPLVQIVPEKRIDFGKRDMAL